MARTKSKRREPGRSEEWPVDDFPYMVVRKYVQHPKYCRTHREAVNYLLGRVTDFEFEMSPFDKDIPASCIVVRKAIEDISVDGGMVDLVIAPYTRTRFQAELVRRRAVAP
jgi:hypothetical protein